MRKRYWLRWWSLCFTGVGDRTGVGFYLLFFSVIFWGNIISVYIYYYIYNIYMYIRYMISYESLFRIKVLVPSII